MTTELTDDDILYRAVLDRLVSDCEQGQGQIGVRRALDGVWNQNATAGDSDPHQHNVNELLGSLTREQRETVAQLFAEAFRAGVFAALVALRDFEVPPFDRAYEGFVFEDFIGRLTGWEWPDHRPRS